MTRKSKAAPSRDDAEAQPESGYPGGRLTTKPSARPTSREKQSDAAAGSEAEFDSKKPESDADASF